MTIQNTLTYATEWFRNFQKLDGMFHYQYNIRTGRFEENDNIVRQIGTALVPQMLGMTDVTSKFRDAIESKIDHVIYNGKRIQIIPFKGLYKTNAVALYTIFQLNDGYSVDELLHGLESMETDNGFLYLYYATNNKVSPMVTGEILYAMAHHMRLSGDDRNFNTMQRIFDQMFHICISGNKTLKQFFAWALYYLGEMTDMGYDVRHYIEPLVDRLLLIREPEPIEGIGAASFLEGISRIYSQLENKSRADIYIDKLVNYITSMQITSIDQLENMIGQKFTGDAKYVLGGFVNNSNAQYIRNDLSQHASASLFNVQKYVTKEDNSNMTQKNYMNFKEKSYLGVETALAT